MLMFILKGFLPCLSTSTRSADAAICPPVPSFSPSEGERVLESWVRIPGIESRIEPLNQAGTVRRAVRATFSRAIPICTRTAARAGSSQRDDPANLRFIGRGQFWNFRCAILIGMILCLLTAAWRSDADGPSLGPLFDHFSLTLSTGDRVEALGPLFYSEETDLQKTWAIPPLMSRWEDAGTDSAEFDLLYPLLTWDRFGTEYRWQLVQWLNLAGGNNQQDQTSRRFTLFPIYFQQRSPDPKRNYTALVPLYGHLQNRFFRDEIFFVLFPIYGQSRKKDVVTDNYLYPIVHVRHGDNLTGWQVWPFVGHEHKDAFVRTNNFGDLERIGGHDRLFVLWPLGFRVNSGMGTENPERLRAILPFYSFSRSPMRDTSSIIWPLFTHIIDRGRGYNEWQTPWPFIEFTRGEGKQTSRVFPFYSHAQNTNLESGWVLWPIYKFNRFHTEAVDRKRTRIVFFLYSDTRQKNLETGQAQRRADFLPLYTWRRDYDGSSRLQILTILEPFVPTSKSIERNYSPLWALWRSEKNTRTGATSQSLLWNLYRRQTTADTRKCSLLFGLFQYQSGPDGKRLRLLYVPVVRTRSATKQ